MDLVTQGLLGAVVGQAGFHRQLGKKAMVWGTVVGLLPDADVFIPLFLKHPLGMEIIHRGLTHSIFFAALMAFPLGILIYLSNKENHRPSQYIKLSDKIFYLITSAKAWIILAFWVLLTHPLLDLFTTFGTQLISPFSDHRFALSAIAIIDPIYSLPLILSLIIGCAVPSRAALAGFSTLLLTTAYLFLGLVQHDRGMAEARTFCAKNKLSCSRIEAFPMIPTIYAQRLWVEASKPDGKEQIYITEYSTWTKKKRPWIMAEKELVPEKIATNPSFLTFSWFTNGVMAFKSTPNLGFCSIDGRFGSLDYKPFGLFSVCFKDDKIRKNKDYDDTQMLLNMNKLSAKFKVYIKIIKNIWVWTFTGEEK